MIAEIYGATILAATVVVMVFQVTIFGKPISSGFFSAFAASGGHKESYFWSKYLKAVLANLVLTACTLTMITMEKFYCLGFWLFLILWSIINPLYLFTLTAAKVIVGDRSYKYQIMKVYNTAAAFGVLSLMTAGTIIYSQNKFWMMYWVYQIFMFNPSAILYYTNQFGFLYRRHVVQRN